MEISALYHRPDSEMAYLKTEEAFQIRLRTKHGDVREARLLYGDPYGNKVNEKDESTWDHDVVLMEKTFETKYHDYFETEVKMPLNRLQYAFHLVGSDGEEILYDDRRVMPYTKTGWHVSECLICMKSTVSKRPNGSKKRSGIRFSRNDSQTETRPTILRELFPGAVLSRHRRTSSAVT